jgi:TrmH RNA methyltransferase
VRPSARDRKPRAPKTERVYGLAAALAVMRVRPRDVLSIAHTMAVRKQLADMLRQAARLRIAYREVDEEELSKMAASVHHEGVCLLAAPRPRASVEELARRTEPRGLILALDRVQNPHNIGAVLRSAAFFGAAGMLLSADGERTLLGPAAVRVAEGGAELVPVVATPALATALRTLRESDFGIVGSDVRATTPLASFRWPQRCVLVLGSEEQGMSSQARNACDALVRIEGNGSLESLNVSVAAGVLLASYTASLADGD